MTDDIYIHTAIRQTPRGWIVAAIAGDAAGRIAIPWGCTVAYDDPQLLELIRAAVREELDAEEIGNRAARRAKRKERRKRIWGKIKNFAKNVGKKLAQSKVLGGIWKIAKKAAVSVADGFTGGLFSKVANKALGALARVAPAGSALSKMANALRPGGPILTKAQQDAGAAALAAAKAGAKALDTALDKRIAARVSMKAGTK